jgi:hypothetical protein
MLGTEYVNTFVEFYILLKTSEGWRLQSWRIQCHVDCYLHASLHSDISQKISLNLHQHCCENLKTALCLKSTENNFVCLAPTGEDCIMKSFMICPPHQILFWWSNQEECDGWGMWHMWGTEEMHTGFEWGKHQGNGQLGRPACSWQDNIKIDPEEVWWGGLD